MKKILYPLEEGFAESIKGETPLTLEGVKKRQIEEAERFYNNTLEQIERNYKEALLVQEYYTEFPKESFEYELAKRKLDLFDLED